MAEKKGSKSKKDKKSQTEKKSNLLTEVIREFSVITWPKGSEFKSTSILVIIFVLMYIVYIGALDLLLKRMFDFLFR